MKYDLQKASILKRISAFILDMILICILAVGFAYLISAITDYDGYNDKLDSYYAKYEKDYGVIFEITEEEYNALPEPARLNYDNALKALGEDGDAVYCYNVVINLTLLITSLGILLSFTLLEFIIPLFLKNGRTIGKKIFGLGLMRVNGVKINTVVLFVRTFLGKYTIETMVPVLLIIMLYFNIVGLAGTVVLILIALLQLILICVTKTNSAIHDLLAATVEVDMASQLIFDSEDEMTAYKNKIHAEAVAHEEYR